MAPGKRAGMQKIKKFLARSKLNIPLPDEITKTDREIAYRRQIENGIAKDEAIPTSEVNTHLIISNGLNMNEEPGLHNNMDVIA